MAATKRSAGRAIREIVAAFQGFDHKTPAEQMAAYFTAGRKLREVVGDVRTYGERGAATVAAQVPQLGTEDRAYLVMRMADVGDDVRDFILGETADPMGNGQPLGPAHWVWAFTAGSRGGRVADAEHLRVELAWLRRESPSEAVLERVTQVLERELDDFRDRVERRASRLLDDED